MNANCYYIDDTFKSIQVFAYKIWIDKTSKNVFKDYDLIYTLLEGEEEFSELVFGEKCLYGITQKGSYKVYHNNCITEFNRNNLTDSRNWD